MVRQSQTTGFFGLKVKLNIFLLLLGLLCLVCFGEEISWGQRIFGWQTPDTIKELNVQQETNIHNLWWFDHRNPDRGFWLRLVNMNRLFTLFWLLFCPVTPLAALWSQSFEGFVRWIGVPLAPVWIGALLLVHAVFFHLFYKYTEFPFTALVRLNELKETKYAFIVALLAAPSYYRCEGRRRQNQRDPASATPGYCQERAGAPSGSHFSDPVQARQSARSAQAHLLPN